MKKILTLASAIMFSSSAFALDISQFSVGLSGNYGLYGGNGKELNYNSGGTVERTTKKDGAAFTETYPSIFVEFAVNDNFSIGLDFADEIESPQNVNSGEGGGTQTTDIKAKATFTDLMTLYVMAKSDLGIYGKLGYTSMDIDVTSENAGTYADPGTNEGYQVALGYEYGAPNGIAIRAELAYHQFDDVSANNGITSSVTSQRNEIFITEMEGATGRISLVKSF